MRSVPPSLGTWEMSFSNLLKAVTLANFLGSRNLCVLRQHAAFALMNRITRYAGAQAFPSVKLEIKLNISFSNEQNRQM